MSRLFPLRSEPDLDGREPSLVELGQERADEVFDALGSKTARTLLSELHAEPRPASELAEAIDTTVQNVQYHLTKLQAAELIEVADTWYGENGAEMKVYAPTDEALVLFAGDDPEGSLRRLLARLIGAMLPVTMAALGAFWWFDRDRGGPYEFQSTGTGLNASTDLSTEVASSGDPALVALALLLGGALALGGYVFASRALDRR